jgi:hypothetical protein
MSNWCGQHKKEDTGFQGSVSSGGEKMRRCAKVRLMNEG